jgi:ferredoxin
VPPKAETKVTWASDVETDDAPTRNAHYRQTFQTSTEAMTLKIHHPELGLIEFSCEPGEYVLDAADRAGHPLPFSCRSGGCLACTGLILSGTAVMGDQYVLEDEQIEAGFYLLCVTSPTSDCEIRSHQEDVVS